MARREMEENSFSGVFDSKKSETFLPGFPNHQQLKTCFPGLADPLNPLNKLTFSACTDFVLDEADEIWERSVTDEHSFFYYLYFFGDLPSVPCFAVEIDSLDDAWTITDFSMIIDDRQLLKIRKLRQVYSGAKEWEKEQLIKNLNDEALLGYDHNDLLKAKDLINAAIQLSGSGRAYLYNNRGLIYWKMGLTDLAKEDFLESISLDQENGDPFFNIGLIYLDEGNYSKALHFMTRASEINPNDTQFLMELGHLHLELGQESKALELFKQAFESNPTDPQIDFHLGYYFLYKKRNPGYALKYYRKGLKKDPQDQFALADMAVALWLLGKRKKTKQVHESIRQCSTPLMPYTMSRLVYLNMEMGDYETALHYYREALNREDLFEPEWLHYNAALVYAKTGKKKQALDVLNIAVNFGGEAVMQRAIGEKALDGVKQTPGFKKLLRLSSKRNDG